MAKIDNSELKRIIAAMKKQKITGLPGGGNLVRPPSSKNRRAAGRIVESFAKKAGLDLGKINHLMAEDQKLVRGAFAKEQAVLGKHFRSGDAAFRSAMASRLQALKYLGQPFISNFI